MIDKAQNTIGAKKEAYPKPLTLNLQSTTIPLTPRTRLSNVNLAYVTSQGADVVRPPLAIRMYMNQCPVKSIVSTHALNPTYREAPMVSVLHFEKALSYSVISTGAPEPPFQFFYRSNDTISMPLGIDRGALSYDNIEIFLEEVFDESIVGPRGS
jgi:hypothetical protein